MRQLPKEMEENSGRITESHGEKKTGEIGEINRVREIQRGEMGAHPTHGEPVEWTKETEKNFLEILAERVKRDPNRAPIFKTIDWQEMDDKVQTGIKYGPDKLKGKYHRMRSVHTKFGELINNTGVTWITTTGMVNADESVWDAFFKRDKIFKTFKKKGCKIYPLLNIIFFSSTATCAFHNASSTIPQTSEEEQAIEQEYLGEFEGLGDNVGGFEACEGQSDVRGKRNFEDLENEYILGQRRALKKKSASEKYDVLMQVWEQSMNAKKERDLAKVERYKSQKVEATRDSDEYSINKYMLHCRTSVLSGKEYIREISCGLLEYSRNVSVEEGLSMGLRILSHGTRQRVICDRFQHFLGTIHRWFKRVLRALKILGVDIVKPVDRGEVQPEIRTIDGTHVCAWAPASKQKSFRGRKAVLVTQNIMAICSLDMMFTFVYTGWEGTPNDSSIFYDAVVRPENKFSIPTGDSGYPNLKVFLAPFRSERYHRRDFDTGGRIRGKEELFNYTHSFIRNVIERAFGVLKTRFHILKDIPNYPFRRQMLIPHACCALHNFIRMEDRADRYFTIYGQDYLEVPGEGSNVVQEGFPLDMTNHDKMIQVRESIANNLWNHHTTRGRR
ncbi:uncharacterized protein LOC141659852 [Apium graveolens]|uniref:uncharacterized protein LOC141659852 n=1 Tax=Apium graveolens TaxID=4045 RepID=UPI003D7AB9E8